MPSTLEKLTRAWREEASQKIRKTLLNQSPRSNRKWREMAGNEPLRHLPALTERAVHAGMPRTGRVLIRCNETAHAARMDRIFSKLAD